MRFGVCPLLLLALFISASDLAGVAARKLPDIYWNSSNPMFDISNTDHVKQVQLLDRVTFVCPQPAPSSRYEYSKLFLVSREGYDKCQLRQEKQLGICATPERQSSISLVFRDFSPLPAALEFKAANSYYVITTSDGSVSGINSSSEAGLCATRNMRMKFDVLSGSEEARKEESHSDHSTNQSRPDIVPPLHSSPIMYVIHTSEPESAANQTRDNNNAGATDSGVKIGGDTDSARSNLPSAALLLFALLAVVDLLDWRRLLPYNT